jgi:heterodisulfide reductase subunit A
VPSRKNSVLVIGGGIAGLQASLDLGNADLDVHLIERSPSVGGRVALLSKVFPTLEDAEDLLTQMIFAVSKHPNVRVLTCSEVREISGEAGDFKVSVVKKPRYVDESRCTSCGECVAVCPVSVPKAFEMGLGLRKAIYLPFPRSYPHSYTINESNCLHFGNNECSACLETCPEEAVNFGQRVEECRINVGAIVVASGSNLYDAEQKVEYGYGLYKNVITGLEFERLCSPWGPTDGKILRVSDGEKPKNVAFILCAGFRDEKGNRYCCRTGCMSALKHAYILKNQYGDGVEAYIFYTDLRAAGLGYEEFYQKARESGLTLIRGKPSEVRPLSEESLNIEVFEATTHRLLSLNADLVVLEGGATPNTDLRERLKIPLRQDGFYAEKDLKLCATETEIRGIFLAGTSHGPKDIPETITHASAASMKVLSLICDSCASSEGL